MTVEVLDEGVEDSVVIGISWLKDLLPAAQVARTRIAGDPLPFILVEFVDGTENVEESSADDVIAVHVLGAKSLGSKPTADWMEAVHRRMLLLARYLEAVALPGGRTASIDYVDVFSRPRWEPYGDDQILRKIGKYRIGLAYA